MHSSATEEEKLCDTEHEMQIGGGKVVKSKLGKSRENIAINQSFFSGKKMHQKVLFLKKSLHHLFMSKIPGKEMYGVASRCKRVNM